MHSKDTSVHGVQSLAFVLWASSPSAQKADEAKAFVTLSPPVFMQIWRHRKHLRNPVTCSDVRRSRREMYESHCLIEWIHNWSTGHRNEARQWSLAVYSGFAMQLINLFLYASFLPKRTSIYRRQNCLAFACCMKADCSEMIQSVFLHRAARNTSLIHHSLLTTHYHTDTVLTILLLMCCVLWCRLCMQKLNFVDRVKIQIWGKPRNFFLMRYVCTYMRFAIA